MKNTKNTLWILSDNIVIYVTKNTFMLQKHILKLLRPYNI